MEHYITRPSERGRETYLLESRPSGERTIAVFVSPDHAAQAALAAKLMNDCAGTIYLPALPAGAQPLASQEQ